MSVTERPARPPSMADVAQAAGVSPQTVSRTLRGSPNVSPATRARVQAAVEVLGYRLNSAARALSSGKSRTIGLVLLQTGGYYSRSAVTAGVEAATEAAGYAVTIATIPTLDTAQMERALIRLGEQGVDGIVIAVPLIAVSARIEEITRQIPTVTLDGMRTAESRVVGIDQRSAGRLATEHLLGLGHRQVWHVAGPEEWIEARHRKEGWKDALTAAGVVPPPVLDGDWSPESGYRQGLLLARMPDVTAVFVGSDEMAFGVIRALREHDRRVPEEVSLVSVDDIELAAFCTPPLTTVRQDFYSSGTQAVRLLLDPEGAAPEEGLREPVLAERASAAPAP